MDCGDALSVGGEPVAWHDVYALAVRGFYNRHAVVMVFQQQGRTRVASLRIGDRVRATAVATSIRDHRAFGAKTVAAMPSGGGWSLPDCMLRMLVCLLPALGVSLLHPTLAALAWLALDMAIGGLALHRGAGAGFVRVLLAEEQGMS